MNVLLQGEERLLAERKLTSLKKDFGVSDDDLTISRYDTEEVPMDQILEDCMEISMFAPRKMVIMTNPVFLTGKKSKNVSDDDVAQFLTYVKTDQPDTLLVIDMGQARADSRKKVVKELKKHAEVFDFEKLDTNAVKRSTRKSLQSRGSDIDDDALELLLERTREDLAVLAKECDKLALYAKHIDCDAVERLVSAPAEDNVFELTNAIMRHDEEAITRIYRDLTVSRDPASLIGLLAHSLRQMYQVKLLTRKGYTDKEIAGILKMNFRAVYPARRNSEGFQLDDLLEKLNALSNLDVAIKTGRMDSSVGLELFLMNMG